MFFIQVINSTGYVWVLWRSSWKHSVTVVATIILLSSYQDPTPF